MYGQAFRIALSYRFRRGELIILNEEEKIHLPEQNSARYLSNILKGNRWGSGHGRSLLVTTTLLENEFRLFEQMATIPEHGLLKDIKDVDVKDLLQMGRVVIEQKALIQLLGKHMDPTERRTYGGLHGIVQYL